MANLSGSNRVGPAQRNKLACTEKQNRQERLNKALRENLLKRKQQSRSRQQQQTTPKDRSALQIKGVQD